MSCWSNLKDCDWNSQQRHWSSCILNRSFVSRSVWLLIYFSIISLSTLPTVAQKYPLAHKCCPQYRFFSSGNSSCISLDDLPLRYCAFSLGDKFVGHDMSMCTWSLLTAPSRIFIPLASHPCLNNSRSLCAIAPFNTWYLYLTWKVLSLREHFGQVKKSPGKKDNGQKVMPKRESLAGVEPPASRHRRE